MTKRQAPDAPPPQRLWQELSLWTAGAALSGALLVATDNPWFLTGVVVLLCLGYGRTMGAPR